MTATDSRPASLLFAFRGVRRLQVLVAIAAVVFAMAGVVTLKTYLDDGHSWALASALLFAVIFIWVFGIALRLPTSFVAISPERMRIRYGGFVDTIVETKDVAGAELVQWKWWQGLGVRPSFRGDVALVAASGLAAEVTLKRPIRVWIIPRILPVKATRVVVSVKNPHKLADRFGPVKPIPSKTAASKRKRR